MNKDLKELLKRIIAHTAASAFEAELVKHVDNPKWQEVVEFLDDFTDEMRALEVSL